MIPGTVHAGNTQPVVLGSLVHGFDTGNGCDKDIGTTDIAVRIGPRAIGGTHRSEAPFRVTGGRLVVIQRREIERAIGTAVAVTFPLIVEVVGKQFNVLFAGEVVALGKRGIRVPLQRRRTGSRSHQGPYRPGSLPHWFVCSSEVRPN